MIVFRKLVPKTVLEASWDRAQIAKAMREARRERDTSFTDDLAGLDARFLADMVVRDDLFRTHEILRDMARTCKDRQDATDLDILADLVGGAYWRHYY